MKQRQIEMGTVRERGRQGQIGKLCERRREAEREPERE